MPPKVKFQKEEIILAALNVAREKGIEAVTAREVAAALGVSPRPIFTYYDTMDALRQDVFASAKAAYRTRIEAGLTEDVPFLGVWRQFLRFAKEEPALFRLLFLTKTGGATAAMEESRELVQDSLMRIYRMDAHTADCFFRDVWLVAFGFAVLIVTDNCPYTENQMLAVGAEISLAVCKAYKEIPGFARGLYDKDALFRELVKKRRIVGTLRPKESFEDKQE